MLCGTSPASEKSRAKETLSVSTCQEVSQPLVFRDNARGEKEAGKKVVHRDLKKKKKMDARRRMTLRLMMPGMDNVIVWRKSRNKCE